MPCPGPSTFCPPRQKPWLPRHARVAPSRPGTLKKPPASSCRRLFSRICLSRCHPGPFPAPQKHEKARQEHGNADDVDENFIRLYWEQMLQARRGGAESSGAGLGGRAGVGQGSAGRDGAGQREGAGEGARVVHLDGHQSCMPGLA